MESRNFSGSTGASGNFSFSKGKEDIQDIWASSLNNRGHCKIKLYKDSAGAKNDAFAALAIFKRAGISYYSMQCYELIGKITYGQGQIDSSILYFDSMLLISNKYNTKSFTARAKNGLARAYKTLQQYKKAEQYGNEALELSKRVRSRIWIADSYYVLSEINRLKGDYYKAYTNYFAGSQYEDSSRNDNNKKAILIEN